jgi:hypothetical protein
LFDLFDIVCFTGDYILTGFGCDQAVNRCVTGALDQDEEYQFGQSLMIGYLDSNRVLGKMR